MEVPRYAENPRSIAAHLAGVTRKKRLKIRFHDKARIGQKKTSPHHSYTNAFKALNTKLRRAVRMRGHLPNDD